VLTIRPAAIAFAARIALDYAAEHPNEVRERIDRNRAMAERSRHTARQREALLA